MCTNAAGPWQPASKLFKRNQAVGEVAGLPK